MKLTKLCLFLVALLATVCVIGCGDPETGTPTPKPSESTREIAFFDFDSDGWQARPFAPKDDGSTIETADGEGIDGSGALYVCQTDTYGEVIIDIPDAYSKGKSYYTEAWFREGGTDSSVNGGVTKAKLSVTIWDQDIVEIAESHGAAYYDWTSSWSSHPGPWDAEVGTDITGYEKALAPFIDKDEDGDDLPLSKEGPINATEWTKLSGIVKQDDVDPIVEAGKPEDLVGFTFVYFCGEYPNQTGYKYYIDNLRILDLDPAVPRGNGVHVDAPALEYGEANVLTFNYADDDQIDVYEENNKEAKHCNFTCTGTLPAGLKFNVSEGFFEAKEITEPVAEGETKEFKVTITATNKAGEATAEVTIVLKNVEE